MSALVVAIDGPAGSGKSSVSKDAARRLGFSYYDTGAAYRALAWAAMTAGIDLTNQDAVVALQKGADYRASEDPDSQTFLIDGEDVTYAIRGGDVSGAVSAIAQHTLVRAGLVEHFRKVLADCENPGIIMEGRDITTVVAPEAPVPSPSHRGRKRSDWAPPGRTCGNNRGTGGGIIESQGQERFECC